MVVKQNKIHKFWIWSIQYKIHNTNATVNVSQSLDACCGNERQVVNNINININSANCGRGTTHEITLNVMLTDCVYLMHFMLYGFEQNATNVRTLFHSGLRNFTVLLFPPRRFICGLLFIQCVYLKYDILKIFEVYMNLRIGLSWDLHNFMNIKKHDANAHTIYSTRLNGA